MFLNETAGWIGTALIVLAYALSSFKKIKQEDWRYQTTNLLGAGLLGWSLFVKTAWPAFSLQCIWAAIALIALLKMAGRPVNNTVKKGN